MNGYINTLNGLLLIQSVIIKILESSNIVENSHSPDTVVGRCTLLKENVGYIRECREQPEFNLELQSAIDEFKQSYYDKPITQTQISLLISANQDQYKKFFYTNIERSLYHYIDDQLDQIRHLKKETAIQKRKSKLGDLLNSCNIETLKLFFTTNIDDPYVGKTENLFKGLARYVELKSENFDELIPVIVNSQYYYDENTAPVNNIAVKLIKKIKSKLWLEQFLIRNQEYQLKLIVNGNDVQLSVDEKASEEFIKKIKSLF